MNDDALPPEIELASAYLDGDVDEDQRAQVDASPELTAMVASFQQVKATMAATPAGAPGTRDAAVAAALAEFDVLRATPLAAAVVAPPANVVSIHRTRWSKVVMGAAAALLLGGVSVAAINSFGSDDTSSSSSGTVAQQKVAGAEASADTAAGGGAGADAPPQTIGAINAAATPVPEVDEPAQLLSLTAAATPPVEATADDTLSGASETTAETPDTTPDQTAAATETTAASVAAATVAPMSRAALSFAFDCQLSPSQVILLEISWRGTPAVAVRDTVSGVILAIDAQCNVLASAP